MHFRQLGAAEQAVHTACQKITALHAADTAQHYH